jgi:capsular polysaccharide biosynthesis protein
MLLRAVRRHKVVFGVFVVLGALAGVALAVLRPPLLSSKVLVVAPQSKGIQTQVVIAGSDPVLSGAIRKYPVLSLEQLRHQVKVAQVTSSALAITVEAKTATIAQAAANAVANSYVQFVKSKGSPGGQVKAQLVCPQGSTSCATPATGATVSAKAAETGGLGALAGILLGGIVVVSIGRTDRRLRERDEIAGAVGAPVLASVPVIHPSDTSGWVRLLEAYEPGVVHAWSLRKALRHVGVADGRSGGGAGVCLGVVSLSADRAALAVGPQLAVYAASLGVPTTLVIGPQQDPDATAALSAACTMVASGSRQAGSLQFAVGEYPEASWLSDAGLTVVVAVADSRSPRLASAMSATTTVLAVSAGVVTAEQLARVAASVTNAGVDIAGILVADPDPADRTTGRLLSMGQPARRRPTAHHRQSGRQTGSMSESRR